ncbi:MAG: TIR domain-containing protein [Nitrospira sp.]|nr:MAG: TIR domain-containing protein [Nitrospira sp.]
MTDDSLDNERNKPQDHDGGIVSYFISYARVDRKHAQKIQEGVEKSSPSVRVWIDERDIEPGDAVAPEIQKAISMCSAMLFLVSRDSVMSSYCRSEIAVARNNKKPIIPLRLCSEVDLPARELPFQIQDTHYIDCWTDFEGGLKKLCVYLARKRGERLPPSMTIEPVDVTTPASPGTTGLIVINEPRLQASADFVGCREQQQKIKDFISNEDSAVLWIWGRAGSGKTALAHHALDQIQCGIRTSPECQVPIHAIAYLNQQDHSESGWLNVFDKIRSSMPTAPRLHSQEKYLASAIADVLSGLTDRRVVVLIDHLDKLIDLEARSLTDPNLRDALRTILSATTHKLKVIVTSSWVLHLDLPPDQKVRKLNLKEGLPELEAMQLLRKLDRDGTVGLRDANDTIVKELCLRMQGNPRAIETLYMILEEDLSISPLDILQDETRFLPEAVLNVLIGESYACLDDRSKIVMQVLSASETAVTTAAVVSVCQRYHPDIDVEQVLNRLVNMQLIEKDNGCYSLRKADRRYIVSQLADGVSLAVDSPEGVHLDRFILSAQHADYIRQVDSADSTAEAKSLALEFTHCYTKRDYVAAVGVLQRLESHLFGNRRYQELAQRYEQLVDKLEDRQLVRRILDKLARIYHRLGDLERAVAYYEKGLECVREARDDLSGECHYLAVLAICKQESGDLVGATLYCRAALELAHAIEGDAKEALIWNTIGEVFAALGQASAAMSASEHARELARDNHQRDFEVGALVNLGQHYDALGDGERAEEECIRACRMAQSIGFQLGESAAWRNLGSLNIGRRRYALAAKDLTKAMKLAEITQSVRLQHTTCIELATALLLDDELGEAKTIVEVALRYDTLLFSPEAHALNGVIRQRQGNTIEAITFFDTALEQAEEVLRRTPRYYRVLDAMGLSYSGLALLKPDQYLDLAVEAYEAARLVTHEPGIVRRRLLLFDALAKIDSERKLTLVRNAIAPE